MRYHWETISRRIYLRVYLCRPHAPWQCGSNEKEGGLLRQYFPRGCSLQQSSGKLLLKAAHRLHRRPRKCLSYKSPAEILNLAPTAALAS